MARLTTSDSWKHDLDTDLEKLGFSSAKTHMYKASYAKDKSLVKAYTDTYARRPA